MWKNLASVLEGIVSSGALTRSHEKGLFTAGEGSGVGCPMTLVGPARVFTPGSRMPWLLLLAGTEAAFATLDVTQGSL